MPFGNTRSGTQRSRERRRFADWSYPYANFKLENAIMIGTASKMIAVASIGIILVSTPSSAQEALTLPEFVLPAGLQAYTSENRVQNTARHVLDQLRNAKIGRHRTGLFSDGLYTDAEFPKRVPDKDGIRYVVKRSPCEDDADALAVHRGFAWTAIAYNLFGRMMEGLDIRGPKFVVGQKSAQTIDLSIAGFGRSLLVRAINAALLARHIQYATEQAKGMPPETRADIRAFLTALLQFRPYYEALAADGESIRDLLYLSGMSGPKPREAARDLVRRMDQRGLTSAHRIAPCLEGVIEHIVTVADGRPFESGSVFSGGIVTYGIGFWWRREREGTSAAANAALRWVISRLGD